jgi:glycosyltransferase involved in cell wall biosynthesis
MKVACVERSVSVAVASFNSAAFLEASIKSALDQAGSDVEILIVDDCSSDDSYEVACRLARADPRVRAVRMERNGGPAAARNRALDLARGKWFAILDSDDLYHPDRLKQLIDAAEEAGADIIADDLLIFDNDHRAPPSAFFVGDRSKSPEWITLDHYLEETRLFGSTPNLGFLKPIIRIDLIRRLGIRYNEDLRIAEDDELIVRLLASGARYLSVPSLSYFYRKHGTSISHRLSLKNAEAMVAAGHRLEQDLADQPASTRRRLAARNRALRNGRDFTCAVNALKGGRAAEALRIGLSHPGMLPLFRMPVAARFGWPAPRRALPRSQDEGGTKICFISRQRLVGATNGSSAYLLDLARTVRAIGMEPHLVQPSPVVFGRRPVLRMRPEMAVFASHAVRGSFRLGSWLIARNPTLYAQAARGVIGRIGRKLGFSGTWTRDVPAPYAVTAPWTKADQLFVAATAPGKSDAVIADYIFQTAAFPYVLQPDAPTATVMHDLFHARTDAFEATGGQDSVATVSREEECALLGRADLVLAIQSREAAFVNHQVPGGRAITVPMGVDPVALPQPGTDGLLLFVGSNTAPNILGLTWFFDRIWPEVRRNAPDARLLIAGTVSWAFPKGGPDGTEFLGLVDDLPALYTRAGIVISPLIQGSGLKIKLVEALAHGKAVVATSVTLQGVEEIAGQAVAHADAADDFATEIMSLIASRSARSSLGERALELARSYFSSAHCHREFASWLGAARLGTGVARQP